VPPEWLARFQKLYKTSLEKVVLRTAIVMPAAPLVLPGQSLFAAAWAAGTESAEFDEDAEDPAILTARQLRRLFPCAEVT